MARLVELNPGGSIPQLPSDPGVGGQPVPNGSGGTDGTWTLYPQLVGVPRITVGYTVPVGDSAVQIQRLGPDGSWTTVRGQTGLAGGTSVQFDDVETAFGYAVRYRATLASGVVLSTSVVSAGLSPAGAWLRHPTLPTMGLQVSLPVDAFSGLTRPSSSASFDVIGRPDAVAVADGSRKALRGTLTIRLRTPAERATWESLTDGEAPLLFDCDVRSAAWDVVHEYLKLGDVTYSNVAGWGDWPARIVSMPFNVVLPSTTAALTSWTLGALGASFTTLAAVGAAYATLGGLAADTLDA